MAGSRSDMYRLATKAIVRVASPPITAPISGARTAAAPARRTSITTPVPPRTVSAGIVAGMLDAQSRVSKVTPPRTVAGPGTRIHGNNESKRQPSGRTSWRSCGWEELRAEQASAVVGQGSAAGRVELRVHLLVEGQSEERAEARVVHVTRTGQRRAPDRGAQPPDQRGRPEPCRHLAYEPVPRAGGRKGAALRTAARTIPRATSGPAPRWRASGTRRWPRCRRG